MAELRFAWDPRKAASNAKKHSVTFEEARSVFLDENALLRGDPEHSDEEERFVLLGFSARLRLLVECHGCRESESVIRLISARKAERREKRQYKERYQR